MANRPQTRYVTAVLLVHISEPFSALPGASELRVLRRIETAFVTPLPPFVHTCVWAFPMSYSSFAEAHLYALARLRMFSPPPSLFPHACAPLLLTHLYLHAAPSKESTPGIWGGRIKKSKKQRIRLTSPSSHTTYQLGEKIGKGGSGDVFTALNLDTGEVVAVKVVRNYNDDDTGASNMESLQTEVEVRRVLANIVYVCGVRARLCGIFCS